MDRKYNGQKIKDKGTDNNLQNTTQKTIDRVSRTPLQTGGSTLMLKIVNVHQQSLDFQNKI